jgi:ankyrin repeat protein
LATVTVPAPTMDSQDAWTELFMAVQRGPDRMKLLLRAGANVNVATADGCTVLHVVAQMGCHECMGLLLAASAVPDARMNDGSTALWLAAYNGHAACVKVLIEANATVACKLENGCSAIWAAASQGNGECLEMLLRTDLQPGTINACNKDGETALHAPAQNGHSDILAMLLGAGIDIHKAANNGKTAMVEAVVNGHTQCLKLLLDAGADVAHQLPDGTTAAFLAADSGDTEALVMLLDACSASSEQALALIHGIGTRSDARGPFHAAAARGHESCLKLLIARSDAHKNKAFEGKHQPCNLAAALPDGISALWLAARGGHASCVELLLLLPSGCPDSIAKARTGVAAGLSALDAAIWAENGSRMEPAQVCGGQWERTILLLRNAGATSPSIDPETLLNKRIQVHVPGDVNASPSHQSPRDTKKLQGRVVKWSRLRRTFAVESDSGSEVQLRLQRHGESSGALEYEIQDRLRLLETDFRRDQSQDPSPDEDVVYEYTFGVNESLGMDLQEIQRNGDHPQKCLVVKQVLAAGQAGALGVVPGSMLLAAGTRQHIQDGLQDSTGFAFADLMDAKRSCDEVGANLVIRFRKLAAVVDVQSLSSEKPDILETRHASAPTTSSCDDNAGGTAAGWLTERTGLLDQLAEANRVHAQLAKAQGEWADQRAKMTKRLQVAEEATQELNQAKQREVQADAERQSLRKQLGVALHQCSKLRGQVQPDEQTLKNSVAAISTSAAGDIARIRGELDVAVQQRDLAIAAEQTTKAQLHRLQSHMKREGSESELEDTAQLELEDSLAETSQCTSMAHEVQRLQEQARHLTHQAQLAAENLESEREQWRAGQPASQESEKEIAEYRERLQEAMVVRKRIRQEKAEMQKAMQLEIDGLKQSAQNEIDQPSSPAATLESQFQAERDAWAKEKGHLEQQLIESLLGPTAEAGLPVLGPAGTEVSKGDHVGGPNDSNEPLSPAEAGAPSEEERASWRAEKMAMERREQEWEEEKRRLQAEVGEFKQKYQEAMAVRKRLRQEKEELLSGLQTGQQKSAYEI